MGKGSKRRRQKQIRKRTPTVRAAQSGGRPRKDGERYANGRLKPVGPNERVVAERRALLASPKAKGLALRPAENPIDLAHARGWLSKELHQAADTLRDLHLRSGIAAPKLRVSNPEPAIRSAANTNASPVALYYLHRVWDRLRPYPQARAALVDVVLLNTWPAWLLELVDLFADGTKPTPGTMEVLYARPDRHALRVGLAMILVEAAKPPPADIDRQGTDLSRFVEWTRAGGLRAA